MAGQLSLVESGKSVNGTDRQKALDAELSAYLAVIPNAPLDEVVGGDRRRDDLLFSFQLGAHWY